VQAQHFSENSDMSRDDGEYPIVAWGAQRNGRTGICICIPTDAGYTSPAEELTFANDGIVPSVARDRNGDAWIAWWKFYDGIFWTHTYVTAVAQDGAVVGDEAQRTISWTLSESAPETWWAVLRARPGEAFESVARVRATASPAMSWTDDTPAGLPLRYRIRRESVDVRYEWVSNDIPWDGAVSTQLALSSVDATPDQVALVWHGPGAEGLHATVERHDASSGWRPLGEAVAAGSDRLEFVDTTVVPSTRYGYRLGYMEDGEPAHTATTWVDVPARLSLALDGFEPNPARAGAVVSVTLPSRGRTQLELLDVSGRRVAHQVLDGLGAGRHAVRIDPARALSPGVYLIRLTHDGARVTSRGVVVR
jgi:hypothetical protein